MCKYDLFYVKKKKVAIQTGKTNRKDKIYVYMLIFRHMYNFFLERIQKKIHLSFGEIVEAEMGERDLFLFCFCIIYMI